MHEYRLTSYSLYAAASMGLLTDDIIEYLNRLSKTDLPAALKDYIRDATASYGKAMLVLRENRYFIETTDADIIQDLLRDPDVASAIVEAPLPALEPVTSAAAGTAASTAAGPAFGRRADASDEQCLAAMEAAETLGEVPDDLHAFLDMVERDGEVRRSKLPDFEIRKESVELVQKKCLQLNYPLLAEYAYAEDRNIANVKMDLKPTCVLRPYQEKSLRKMFQQSRARSGVIVLPCGAGKTLTGVTAACTIKKRTIVLCTSGVAVEQWCSEFARWCMIDPRLITQFTKDCKAIPAENGVLVTT